MASPDTDPNPNRFSTPTGNINTQRIDITQRIDALRRRFTHHPPFGNQAVRYDAMRSHCLNLATIIVTMTPDCPEQQRALDKLDEVMFLVNAAIARHE